MTYWGHNMISEAEARAELNRDWENLRKAENLIQQLEQEFSETNLDSTKIRETLIQLHEAFFCLGVEGFQQETRNC